MWPLKHIATEPQQVLKTKISNKAYSEYIYQDKNQYSSGRCGKMKVTSKFQKRDNFHQEA